LNKTNFSLIFTQFEKEDMPPKRKRTDPDGDVELTDVSYVDGLSEKDLASVSDQ
jgi:hypothetical protein